MTGGTNVGGTFVSGAKVAPPNLLLWNPSWIVT